MPLRPANEDLFEHTRMTFGEHLEELRKVLFRALLGVAFGVIAGMFFAEAAVRFLERPLTHAITEFTVTQAEGRLRQNSGGVVPLEYRENLEKKLAPRRVQIDPEQLRRALEQADSPGPAVSSLPATRFHIESLDPSLVRAAARRWVEVDPESAAPLAALWRALAPGDQATVRELAATDPLGPEELGTFVAVLNRLASNADLHREPAFAPLLEGFPVAGTFSASEAEALRELKASLEAGGSGVNQLKPQLNQWLIWSALAPDMPRPDVRFAEIDIWESVAVVAQSLSATEAFMIWMKAGLILGIVIASPWIFYQLWSFVASGLYPHERRYVYYYLPISLGLFLAGAALAFFFVFDPVLKFLLQFNANLGIDPQPRIGDWMSFVLLLPLGFGIAFQLPIVMLFLNLIGIFSVQDYLSKWRVAVLVIFIISMILTPAEPISMTLMAIPLTCLYFFGIAMCVWLRPKRSRLGATTGSR
jgi:sec-independent protein translocase protein TatC